MIEEIYGGSTVMRRLVDDLLDFSRLEQERFRLQRRAVSASEALQPLVSAFRVQPGGERIVAEIRDGLLVFVDPERFTQIVGNLLANALHYAPDGPITLRAGRFRGPWLRLEVEDCGPGIPLDEQPRVWDKFYRGSLPIHSTQRGSGLGLAVVRSLVELHGGRVGLKSAPGRGATFWVTVPLASQSTSMVSSDLEPVSSR
jgi:two-component system phosphate regulon sensor histidine kinase PhoR